MLSPCHVLRASSLPVLPHLSYACLRFSHAFLDWLSMVQELILVKPERKVYKVVGPIMLVQDLPDAKANVKKRLQFITDELWVASPRWCFSLCRAMLREFAIYRRRELWDASSGLHLLVFHPCVSFLNIFCGASSMDHMDFSPRISSLVSCFFANQCSGLCAIFHSKDVCSSTIHLTSFLLSCGIVPGMRITAETYVVSTSLLHARFQVICGSVDRNILFFLVTLAHNKMTETPNNHCLWRFAWLPLNSTGSERKKWSLKTRQSWKNPKKILSKCSSRLKQYSSNKPDRRYSVGSLTAVSERTMKWGQQVTRSIYTAGSDSSKKETIRLQQARRCIAAATSRNLKPELGKGIGVARLWPEPQKLIKQLMKKYVHILAAELQTSVKENLNPAGEAKCCCTIIRNVAS